jgi:hypothetical protein
MQGSNPRGTATHGSVVVCSEHLVWCDTAVACVTGMPVGFVTYNEIGKSCMTVAVKGWFCDSVWLPKRLLVSNRTLVRLWG